MVRRAGVRNTSPTEPQCPAVVRYWLPPKVTANPAVQWYCVLVFPPHALPTVPTVTLYMAPPPQNGGVSLHRVSVQVTGAMLITPTWTPTRGSVVALNARARPAATAAVSPLPSNGSLIPVSGPPWGSPAAAHSRPEAASSSAREWAAGRTSTRANRPAMPIAAATRAGKWPFHHTITMSPRNSFPPYPLPFPTGPAAFLIRPPARV